MPSRGVLKGHLKKEAGVKALVKRAVNNMKDKLDHYEVTNEVPPPLQSVIQPIKEKLTLWKSRFGNGEEGVIQQCLESLPDHKIEELYQIFSVKGRGANTENKILDSSFVVVSELNDINGFINELFKLKAEVINTYTELYARSFNNSVTTSSEVQFNNEPLLDMIKEIIRHRKRLRREAQASSNDDRINGKASEDANRCVLM